MVAVKLTHPLQAVKSVEIGERAELEKGSVLDATPKGIRNEPSDVVVLLLDLAPEAVDDVRLLRVELGVVILSVALNAIDVELGSTFDEWVRAILAGRA